MFKLFIANLKLLVRNRQQLFWTIMFPLIFTVIFGFFFGKGSVSSGTVVLVNHSRSGLATNIQKAMEKTDLFKLQTEDNENTATDLIKKNQVTAAVVIPEHFGDTTADSPKTLTVILDPGKMQSNAIVESFLNQYLTAASFQIQQAKPLFNIAEQKTTSVNFGYFDFVLVGLIGMALMNSSIQGVAIAMSQYREDQILKRITTTPLPAWKFIVTQVASRLVLNVVQVGLILAVGIYAFSGHINGNYGLILGLSLVGAVLFQLIGFTIASVAKSTQGAEGMATAIAIPMMFLAGVFFPIDQLPKWLFDIVQYLPLAPLLRMIRTTALEAANPFTNLFDITLVVVWIIALLIISSFKFRLTEE